MFGVCAAAAVASADPLLGPPVIAKGILTGDTEGDAWIVGFVGEARALGVVGAERLTAWPDRQRGIEREAPELVAGRAGIVAHSTRLPLSFVARIDFAEPTTPRFDLGGDPIGASIDTVVDDLYVLWRPRTALQLYGGRARVPFSKLRQYEDVDLPAMSTPFVVDRIAPDRRLGVTLHGDLGAMAYAAGVYEDLDALEPRMVLDDPSLGGALMGMAHVEWTPAAPMMGSNPPGKIAGARGPLPTPRRDPWFATARVSIGLGALYRLREDGTSRVDGTASVQLKWRWLAALSEVILSSDAGGSELGAWGELMATPADLVSVSARAEWDGGAATGGEWSVGGGLSWHATRDRRSRIGFFGWLRGDAERGQRLRYDGFVVLVQAAL